MSNTLHNVQVDSVEMRELSESELDSVNGGLIKEVVDAVGAAVHVGAGLLSGDIVSTNKPFVNLTGPVTVVTVNIK
jgi:hypothetical protein